MKLIALAIISITTLSCAIEGVGTAYPLQKGQPAPADGILFVKEADTAVVNQSSPK